MPSPETDHKQFHRPIPGRQGVQRQARRVAGLGPAKPVRKRLRRIPSLWARVAVLSVVVIALLALIVHITLKAIYPYRQASVEAASLAETRERIAALQASNVTLMRQIAYLKTPQGIAAEAHPLGYVRPGEKILVMPGFPSADADANSTLVNIAPVAPPPARPSLATRFWEHLRDF